MEIGRQFAWFNCNIAHGGPTQEQGEKRNEIEKECQDFEEGQEDRGDQEPELGTPRLGQDPSRSR